ncbi:GABBR [Mytilus edulis]|uniref:GABBR n=1 Tax=Mytilus edulis TaxID=6550 RepID=A0A8S3SLT9_MYTED|nr:GABBR [Mytilus edulis]
MHFSITIFIVVLENIFKSPHKIRGKDLTVEPCYPAFHGEVIAALKEMETNGHLDHYLTMIERKSGYESMNIRKVEESVEKRKDNVGNRTSNSSIRILSADMTEYEDDEGYQMPLASGGGDERKDFEKQKKFTETTRSEHIYSEIYEEDLPPLPTTPRPSVKRSEVADEYKEKINMDKGKIILLKIRGFSKECAACQIDLNSDKDEIIFIGSQDVVMAAKLHMYECLEESVEETKYVSKGFAAILKENSSWIKETLKKEKVHAYCTLKDDKKDANLLCCQAFSKPLAEKGIKTIMANLEKVELPYNEGHFKYVNSKEWTDLVSKLKNQNKVEVEMIKDKKLIVVSGEKGDFQTAKDLIKKELNKHQEAKSEKIEIKGSKSVCFDHGMKDKLEKIKSDIACISKRNGSLLYKHDPRKQTTVIEMKGDSAIVEEKKAEISQLVAAIWQGTLVLSSSVVDYCLLYLQDEENDITHKEIYTVCTSSTQVYWLCVQYVYKGLLLAFGTFLAWETRRVEIPALNDSKLIGFCVYNIVVVCLIGVPLNHILDDEQKTARFVLMNCFVMFCTALVLCILFIPKLKLRNETDNIKFVPSLNGKITSTVRPSQQTKAPSSGSNPDEKYRASEQTKNGHKSVAEASPALRGQALSPNPTTDTIIQSFVAEDSTTVC